MTRGLLWLTSRAPIKYQERKSDWPSHSQNWPLVQLAGSRRWVGVMGQDFSVSDGGGQWGEQGTMRMNSFQSKGQRQVLRIACPSVWFHDRGEVRAGLHWWVLLTVQGCIFNGPRTCWGSTGRLIGKGKSQYKCDWPYCGVQATGKPQSVGCCLWCDADSQGNHTPRREWSVSAQQTPSQHQRQGMGTKTPGSETAREHPALPKKLTQEGPCLHPLRIRDSPRPLS